jgi:hypothetical protein
MTRIDQREGLHALVGTIEQDGVKTVFLLSEYSLSRGASCIDVNSFIELCRQHHVYMVTRAQGYEFADPMHVQLFRFAQEAESSARYARATLARRFKALRKATAAQEGKE